MLTKMQEDHHILSKIIWTGEPKLFTNKGIENKNNLQVELNKIHKLHVKHLRQFITGSCVNMFLII